MFSFALQLKKSYPEAGANDVLKIFAAASKTTWPNFIRDTEQRVRTRNLEVKEVMSDLPYQVSEDEFKENVLTRTRNPDAHELLLMARLKYKHVCVVGQQSFWTTRVDAKWQLCELYIMYTDDGRVVRGMDIPDSKKRKMEEAKAKKMAKQAEKQEKEEQRRAAKEQSKAKKQQQKEEEQQRRDAERVEMEGKRLGPNVRAELFPVLPFQLYDGQQEILGYMNGNNLRFSKCCEFDLDNVTHVIHQIAHTEGITMEEVVTKMNWFVETHLNLCVSAADYCFNVSGCLNIGEYLTTLADRHGDTFLLALLAVVFNSTYVVIRKGGMWNTSGAKKAKDHWPMFLATNQGLVRVENVLTEERMKGWKPPKKTTTPVLGLVVKQEPDDDEVEPGEVVQLPSSTVDERYIEIQFIKSQLGISKRKVDWGS